MPPLGGIFFILKPLLKHGKMAVMDQSSGRSFFSIRSDLVPQGVTLAYDLYVNSSAAKSKDHFVRIFPKGDLLSKDDFEEMLHKYHQLYVPENQRSAYIKALTKSDKADDVTKTSVIKDAAIEYLHKIFDKNKEFSTEVLSESIQDCREAVEGMVDVLDNYSIENVRDLISNLSFHDFYTYDHSINVSMYCMSIYRMIFPKAPRIEIVHAGLGGLLHDLGKIKIPTHILNSPGGLTDEEYGLIKKHPGYGLELLLSGQVEVADDLDLRVISRVVHEHHENWDGKGYPRGLKEKEIHPMARVCTIADFFDAITTKRSYSEVLHIAEAIGVMKKFRGTKLDPKIFDLFEKHIHYIKADLNDDLKLADSFDPTIPHEKLPVEKVKINAQKSFGKIVVKDKEDKPQKKKA